MGDKSDNAAIEAWLTKNKVTRLDPQDKIPGLPYLDKSTTVMPAGNGRPCDEDSAVRQDAVTQLGTVVSEKYFQDEDENNYRDERPIKGVYKNPFAAAERRYRALVVDGLPAAPMYFWPDQVLDYVDTLSLRDRKILYGLYDHGLGPSDLARKLKVSPAAICQRRNILKGDLVARFGDLTFHDAGRFVARRMKRRAAKKNVKRRVISNQ